MASRLITNRTAKFPKGPKPAIAGGDRNAIYRQGSTRVGVMNKTEEGFFKTVLQSMILADRVDWWLYESITLRLTDPASDTPAIHYRPDFAVERVMSQTIEFYEVKGSGPLPRDTRKTLALAAKTFPQFSFFLARKQVKADGGGFIITRY